MKNKLLALIFLTFLSGIIFADHSILAGIPPAPEAGPTADFLGNPTTVIVGDSSVFTDLSTTPVGTTITSRHWYFTGGTPDTSSTLNPMIFYNAAGQYKVTLAVFNAQGSDSIIKTDYIKVIPPSTERTDPDFYVDQFNLLVGDSTSFHDLTQGDPLSWYWKFEGGTPATSSAQNPAFIKYSTAGDYKVTLITSNTLPGSDSIIKYNYIHVRIDAGTAIPIADFGASPRLITTGESVSFTDSSLNFPVQWQWTFTGGIPSTSTVQNPIGIVYATSGFYDVTLCATNLNGTSCLTKTEYIYVTQVPILSYCDTINNVLPSEGILAKKLTTGWGYIAGTNHKKVKAYADKYTNYTFGQVNSLFFPVARSRAFNTSANTQIKFCVWNEASDGSVGVQIGSVLVPMSQLPANYYKVVNFTTPVQVNGTFFIGFEVNYVTNQQDTFVLNIANDRGVGGLNTLWIKNSVNTWQTYNAFFNNNNLNTSLAMEPRMCLVEVPEIESDNTVTVFPNPANDFVILDFGVEEAINVQVHVFDLMGKQIWVEKPQSMANQIKIETADFSNGMYFLNIKIGNKIISKKISVIR